MAQIGIRIVVHQPEGNQHRQTRAIANLDGVFERRVERGALRLLHPVEDVMPAALVAVIEPPASRGFDHRCSPFTPWLSLKRSRCAQQSPTRVAFQRAACLRNPQDFA
jgi:hypothetical protein